MRRMEEIIEEHSWLVMLWGLVAGIGLITVIAMMAEILFPE
nr:K196 [uncultured bacterium]